MPPDDLPLDTLSATDVGTQATGSATHDEASSERSSGEHFEAHPVVSGGLALWALFLGFTMLMVGNGLNLAVLGVGVVVEGFGVHVSGFVMACYFAGFLLGPAVVVRLLSGVGHIRVFASLASVASCAVLVHFVWVSPVSWAMMRFVFGFCMAGLYVVVESWLNDASTARTRGRTLAFYMIASMGGLALGQLLIVTAETHGYTLFLVSSILVSLSFVPMALAATTDAPPVRWAERLGVRELAHIAPTGLVGMVFTGVAQGLIFGLAAVYATDAGFGATRTAVFIALPPIGALVCQWPIGWVSDRTPRRGVIFVVAVAATVVCALLSVSPEMGPTVLVLMFLLGGLTFPLHSLLLSHTLDRSPAGKAMSASGALLRVNGAGAVVGPIAGGFVMGALGEASLFWCLAVAHGVIAVYVAYRLVAEESLPMSRQGPFVALPARSTDFALRLAARPLRVSRAKLRRDAQHKS